MLFAELFFTVIMSYIIYTFVRDIKAVYQLSGKKMGVSYIICTLYFAIGIYTMIWKYLTSLPTNIWVIVWVSSMIIDLMFLTCVGRASYLAQVSKQRAIRKKN